MSYRSKRFYIDVQVKNSLATSQTDTHKTSFPSTVKKLDTFRKEELIGNWEMFNIIESNLIL